MNRRPILPYALGIAGLIPFIVFAFPGTIFITDIEVVSASAIVSYAAVILSFLAGARWGAELAVRPDASGHMTLIASMFPPILAWIALLVVFSWHERLGLEILFGGLLVQFLWDFFASSPLPRWYPKLRLLLSSVAMASIAFAMFSYEPFDPGDIQPLLDAIGSNGGEYTESLTVED